MLQKGLNSIIILGAWTLWRHHNDCVFNGRAPSMATDLIMAGEEKSMWAIAGAKALSGLDVHEEMAAGQWHWNKFSQSMIVKTMLMKILLTMTTEGCFDYVGISKDKKQIMHMWNSFVKKQRVLADRRVPWACEVFSRLYGQQLVQNTALLWCWHFIMIKLWNHNILDARTMNTCNIILQGFQDGSSSAK
ncbi:hypothetical protein PR202_gb12158 [Eleusine coracana subsp. coracana]|uniref:Polycomb protein VEFS-Box domain-containing protein n=1 Tax=Eleusine coracana subsp. coracana TaxID=191504 RepID=A0AAV5EQA9_ELECO|nr:hypothetical protein PR202_gb12158 [Eleusine coracana subsp. coracana]